jgi:hypothetical protein
VKMESNASNIFEQEGKNVNNTEEEPKQQTEEENIEKENQQTTQMVTSTEEQLINHKNSDFLQTLASESLTTVSNNDEQVTKASDGSLEELSTIPKQPVLITSEENLNEPILAEIKPEEQQTHQQMNEHDAEILAQLTSSEQIVSEGGVNSTNIPKEEQDLDQQVHIVKQTEVSEQLIDSNAGEQIQIDSNVIVVNGSSDIQETQQHQLIQEHNDVIASHGPSDIMEMQANSQLNNSVSILSQHDSNNAPQVMHELTNVQPTQANEITTTSVSNGSAQLPSMTTITTSNGTVTVMNAISSGNATTLIDAQGNVVDSSMIIPNTLDLDGENSNPMDEDQNDTSLKDIDDSLAMSPSFIGSGSANGTFILNGNNVSTHTFRKTEWDVKKLENYVRLAFNDSTPMENMPPVQMNRYLKSFFELAKKSDGMDYEPESLIGFMNSFERYLKTKNYPESLLRSDTFKDSRTVLKKKRDLVRSIGKLIRTKTKDTCYLLQFHRNLLKEKGLLNRDNPDCLLAEIYLNNMIFFGDFLKEDKAWRGNLNLVWGDMILERDVQNGLEYLTLATYAKKTSRPQHQQQNQQQISPGNQNTPKSNSRTRTGTQTSKLRAAAAAAGNSIQGAIDLNSPRVYARQPAAWCPVEAYKVYRSRRPNNCLDRDSPFYLAPLFKSKNQSKVWYKALAMSCQRLDALFYCLFKKAGVDLTSLASMSQQQQQQAVAAAASIINNNDSNTITISQMSNSSVIGTQQMANISGNNSNLTQWKGVVKDSSQLGDDINELIMSKHIESGTNTAYAAHGIIASNGTFYTTGTAIAGQQAGSHHIVTTVPAQVQVQVQVQVQLPQHQQQQQQKVLMAANSTSQY